MIRPSRIIMRHNGEPYLHRWHIIPRNRWFNVYLHHFLGSDDERALHDHPWWSVSFLLKGQLGEHYQLRGTNVRVMRYVPWLKPIVRRPEHAHRLLAHDAWTLFITGPRVRSWGFWCAQGWRHWRDYEAENGCD